MTQTHTPEAVENHCRNIHDYITANKLYAPYGVAWQNALRTLSARIEELEANLSSATMDGYDMAKHEYRDRIEELEAKLAKAVAAGVRVRNYYENHGNSDVYAVADFNAAIAELKGENQ